MSKEQWAERFAVCDVTFRSKEASSTQKQNAWRRQTLMLCQQTSLLSDCIHFALLKEHQNKLQKDKSTENTMKERLSRCQRTIRASRRINSHIMCSDNMFTMPQQNAFEPSCKSSYESCQRDEMTSRDLLLNDNNLAKNPAKPKPISTPVSNLNFPESRSKSDNENNHQQSLQENSSQNGFGFRTAREQLILDDLKKKKQQTVRESPSDMMNFRKKKLGGKRTVSSNFVSPLRQSENFSSSRSCHNVPPALAQLDPKMVEQILGESMHDFKPVAWEDIAGLESAKSTFLEAIIMPLRRPDLFTGVRCPPRGVLLFGPPGTGKTLIAKSIASQAKAKFFSINPSSLTSKWVGEAEKLVKTLFAVAAAHQPAIIFIDEVDSLLSKRSGNENESTLRLKNEFLIHLDGAASNEETRLLVIGATNRPQELDEAVRRRFVRRLYVPLPTKEARQKIIEKIIRQVKHNLDDFEIHQLSEYTDGYSGADVDSLCRYASMAPLRALTPNQMETIESHQLPPVTMDDFKQALRVISKSVSAEDCKQFEAWNEVYGVRH
ncbi:fidgetin-like protein 1 isoform X1 [Drosophila elegans]|uniref:fidgetin-like protein 1 isoform X1 n=1 Tax=Drosophila elegans TaxID=30023 RepID=UPI001BC8462C|nr:fidgetin-like protein 1 isoform X1 [Drosophila elegans]